MSSAVTNSSAVEPIGDSKDVKISKQISKEDAPIYLKLQGSGNVSPTTELLNDQTTAWNTDAVLSDAESEIDLALLEPLEGWKWEHHPFPE